MNASYVPFPQPCRCYMCKKEIVNETPVTLDADTFHQDCFKRLEAVCRTLFIPIDNSKDQHS